MPSTVSVSTLVDRLVSAEGAPITSERIRDLLDGARVEPSSLRRYVRFSGDHYTRNLIHRDAWFDIMVLCWSKGQGTPIHTHNGQLGWAYPVSGPLDCHEYAWRGCDRPENQNVAGLDCLAGGMRVQLDSTAEATATPGGAIGIVDKRLTIHSLGCPSDADERTVSLHVYSLPFDSCVVFDQARGGCRRKELVFDSAPDGYDVRLREDGVRT